MNRVYPWQQSQWQRLSTAFARDRLPHALLLAGPSGLGLDDFAGALAAKWLCIQPAGAEACGRCRACILYQAANHPDLARVEPEEAGKQIKVDDIRELVRFMQLSSQYGRGKIAVIIPAEAMNRSAANALLKILEEPPAGCVFVLVTNQPVLLPVTIRSRCQRIDFVPDYTETTIAWLTDRLGVDARRAADVLTLARGRPLQAVMLTENDTIKRQGELLADLARLVDRPDDVTATAQRWQDFGTVEVFDWLQQFLSAMTRLKITPAQTTSTVSDLNRDLQRLANRLDLQALIRGYDLAFQNYRAITGPYNLNQTGLLEQFIVFWQQSNGGNGGMRQ